MYLIRKGKYKQNGKYLGTNTSVPRMSWITIFVKALNELAFVLERYIHISN